MYLHRHTHSVRINTARACLVTLLASLLSQPQCLILSKTPRNYCVRICSGKNDQFRIDVYIAELLSLQGDFPARVRDQARKRVEGAGELQQPPMVRGMVRASEPDGALLVLVWKDRRQHHS